MNPKSLERRFPRIQPIEITPGNTELIHDDRLSCDFLSAQVFAGESGGGAWNAYVIGTMTCATPTQMLAIVSDVIERHPDYTAGNNYGIVISYDRFHIEIPFGPDLDELREGVDEFRNLVNLLCLIYYYFKLDENYEFDGLGRPIIEDSPTLSPTWQFQPVGGSATKDDLIAAARSRKYIALQQGVGITSPGKPMKFYTSGASHFTNHPGLGNVPGGMRFIDLSTFDGENHVYTEQELGTIA
ncbi:MULTISPECIES: hypothetical protein [Pandoraea]|uniref:hypothetical protein n=1 Tax=Pandoraea TaxID=93217 RepID=UPI001F5C616D|nr:MULTISPECIES: hypothetical protein [Pandoraea]MCI3205468.1 hypothetical protein [Pandoraea sp. LA3]MDN4583496.1 hypothetical protein [Pandoraea capi]